MRIAFLGDTALVGCYDAQTHGMRSVIERFVDIIHVLNQCDFVVANLESPLTDIEKTNEYKTLALRTPEKNVEVLTVLGINIVSLANNHIYDYGDAGLNSTLRTLDKAGIKHFGTHKRTLTLKKDGISASLSAYCCLTTNAWHYDIQKGGHLNTLTREALEDQIMQAQSIGAYPIISLHWGEENTNYPRQDHWQLMSEILDKNAATVIGHHPHVLQGIKQYKQGTAAFSLGNFCFDDCVSDKSNLVLRQTEDNRKSMIMVVELDEYHHVQYEYVPINDSGSKIVIDYSIMSEVERYSNEIVEIVNPIAYELKRAWEQSKAREKRLGKRDLAWVLGHMNKDAIMSVLQRKYNAQKYSVLSSGFWPQNKMESIVYVGNFDRPDLSAAGKRVYGNALILRELGYDVMLIGKSKKEEVRNAGAVEIAHGIRYVSFPEYGMLKCKRYIEWMEQCLNRHCRTAKVIIRYGSPALADFDARLLRYAQKRDIPVIADVVDWLSADGNSFLFNAVKTIDTWVEKAWQNKRCDGVIAISTYLSKYYRKSVAHVVTIPPVVEKYTWIEPDKTSSQVRVVYAGSPFRRGRKVSNVHRLKDRLDLAVEAISELNRKDLLFDIYGITMDEYLIAFPQHDVVLENTASQITFHGMIDMKQVQKEVAQADFTILLREVNRATMAGFPTKIVESIACGTPVITTRTSDLPDYLLEEKNGKFVSIGKKQELNDALSNVLSIPKERIREMKKYCVKSEVFLYRHYESVMKKFIEEVAE